MWLLPVSFPLLAAFGCAGPEPDPGAPADAGVPADVGASADAAAPVAAGVPADSSAAIVRTADPQERGFTPETFPRVQRLAPGVYSYEQLRSAGEETFTTVSLFVVTSEGVLVADGQGSIEETQRLIETIAGITDEPIEYVVICSDHGDHTGGNAAFPRSATFVAHPTSAAELKSRVRPPDQGTNGGSVVLPTELLNDRKVIRLGEEEIHVLFLGRAHTGGDLVVYLPAEKILFMSEAYLNRIFPAMRSAYPSEWVTMIEKAQAMDVDVYVPGHGFVEAAEILEEELETYRQALEQVIAEATRLHASGATVAEAVAQARFGGLEDWSLRSSQAPTAIRRVYMELNGELPLQPR